MHEICMKHVEMLLDKAAITVKDQNRYYVKTLIELIILCGRQEIALRGHDESEYSETKGKFFEIVANMIHILQKDCIHCLTMQHIYHLLFKINWLTVYLEIFYTSLQNLLKNWACFLFWLTIPKISEK